MCITASKNFTKFRGKYLCHKVKNFAYIFLQINLFSRIFYRVIFKDFYLINRCLSSKALYNSLLLCENKTGLAIGSCLICQISRAIMILSICCLSTLLEICLKRPNQWKYIAGFFFFNIDVKHLLRYFLGPNSISWVVVADRKPWWKQICFCLA